MAVEFLMPDISELTDDPSYHMDLQLLTADYSDLAMDANNLDVFWPGDELEEFHDLELMMPEEQVVLPEDEFIAAQADQGSLFWQVLREPSPIPSMSPSISLSESSRDSSDQDYSESEVLGTTMNSDSDQVHESSSSASDSESDYEVQKSPPQRRVQNRKSPNVAHWLLQLLKDSDYEDVIAWTNKRGEFKILDQLRLAKLWGQRREKALKKKMTYANLARTMRFHYKKSKGKELQLVRKKLVYRFSEHFLAPRI